MMRFLLFFMTLLCNHSLLFCSPKLARDLNKQKELNTKLKSDQENLIRVQGNSTKYLDFLRNQNNSLKRKLSILAPTEQNRKLSIKEQLKRVKKQNSILNKAFDDLTIKKLQPATPQLLPPSTADNTTGTPTAISSTTAAVSPSASEGEAISPLLFKAASRLNRTADAASNASSEGQVVSKEDLKAQKRELSSNTSIGDNPVSKQDFILAMNG
jgi:hypothetical protein